MVFNDAIRMDCVKIFKISFFPNSALPEESVSLMLISCFKKSFKFKKKRRVEVELTTCFCIVKVYVEQHHTVFGMHRFKDVLT